MKEGKQSIKFNNNVYIISGSSVVGPKEGVGKFKDFYDVILKNDTLNQKSYEKAESLMHLMAIQNACLALKILPDDLDAVIAGDLINQITASTFAARKINTSFFGMYAACATFGESLILGALLIESQNAKILSCSTSSHFSTSERQFRYPLELGTAMTPTSQRTITGAGASILSYRYNINDEKDENNKNNDNFQCITYATIGKVIDYGLKNANNMGAAMAPAAFDCFITHLEDSKRSADYYDLILTGDLGKFGKEIFIEMCKRKGIEIENFYDDSGAMIYGENKKRVMGGSGAGCISVMFNSYVLKNMKKGKFNKVLIIPTGALLSSLSPLQNESIPSIAYCISIENK